MDWSFLFSRFPPPAHPCDNAPMPVEAKPLFRPDVVARRVRGFVLPERVVAAEGQLRNWAALVRDRVRFESYGEQELLPEFLSDVFGTVLGYTGPASGGARYTMSREKHVEVEGEFADAVLGVFGAGPDRPVLAVEGKESSAWCRRSAPLTWWSSCPPRSGRSSISRVPSTPITRRRASTSWTVCGRSIVRRTSYSPRWSGPSRVTR